MPDSILAAVGDAVREHPAQTAVAVYLAVVTASLLRAVATKRPMALLTQLVLFAASFTAGAIYAARRDSDRFLDQWHAVAWLVLSGVWLVVGLRRYRRDHLRAKIPAAAK